METKTTTKPKSSGTTIQETKPASWDFVIHEDTPQEEAEILMEHSTLTLDLSSDDESTKKDSFRGKENTPPEGYSAQAASRSAITTTLGESNASIEPTTSTTRRQHKHDFTRTKLAEMNDGERSALSALEVDEFIPEGVDKEDFVVVEGSPEKAQCEHEDVYSAPPPTFSFTKYHKPQKRSATKASSDVDSDILVFEDDQDTSSDGSVDENGVKDDAYTDSEGIAAASV